MLKGFECLTDVKENTCIECEGGKDDRGHRVKKAEEEEEPSAHRNVVGLRSFEEVQQLKTGVSRYNVNRNLVHLFITVNLNKHVCVACKTRFSENFVS